jgi:hypothetical protein
MSKINEILRNGYLARSPAHDLSAASETANADGSLQAILARTPTRFVQATAELMQQNPGRTAKMVDRLAHDRAAQYIRNWPQGRRPVSNYA